MPDPITSSSASSAAASAATTAPVDVPPPPPAPAPKPAVSLELAGAHPMSDAERQAVLAFATAALAGAPGYSPLELPPSLVNIPSPALSAAIDARLAHDACVAEAKKAYEEAAKPIAFVAGAAFSGALSSSLPGVEGPLGGAIRSVISATASAAAKQAVFEIAGYLGQRSGESSCE